MTTYVYETLNITSDGFTDLSINDKGQIAGDTYDGTNYHGFVYSNGSSTAVTYPGGSTSNQVFAINDSGEVVGSFVLSGATNGFSANSPYSGGGNFGPDDPGTPSSATAINTAGLIAGSFYNGTIYKAFIAAGGSFYDLSPPNNDSTSSSQFAVNSINNSDKVSGFYYNSTDATTVGFVYTYTGTNYLGGSFSTIADPNGNSVGNTYINDSGLIAGNYTNTSTFDETGFLDKNGTYTDIAPSGSTQTRVVGINNAGQVAGVYTTDGSHFYGFIYNSTNGTYATITDQGSQITELESINNEGQVVGWNATGQAFVAAPTPTIAINAIDGGTNVINAAEAAAGVTISGTETSADSQTVTVKIINNTNAVVDSYTTTAASGTWSVNVTKTQAQALANGSYTVTANVSDAFGNAATQATQAITVDETVPTIAANTVPEVTTAQAASGFTISGTESGADGQTVTVDILDGSGNVVATDTATASSGAWTVHVTQALTQALPADNMYEVTANVSDQYGNAASQAVTSLMMLPATPANADALDIFSVQNDPVAINDSGQLAATTDGYDTFGVLYSGGAYTAISLPGAGAQQFYELRALSINASGEVAGWSFPAGSSQQFGFIDNNGTYTTVAPAGATFSEVLAINNAGQVAGISNASNGFYFVESNGAYATFSPPAGNTTSSLSINNLGQVAGTYLAGTDKGFVYSGGQFTSISPAGSTSTLARSINDSGQVAGSYSNGTTTEGFIYSNGTYTNIFDPKGTATNVEAINNAGQVGGYYVNGSNVDVGFVYSNGTYTDIPLAGSTDTVVESINNSGQVAGYFNNGTSYEAFIASFVPATPPTVAINPVDGNNIINAAEAAAGVSIRGTESNANGQTVTVKILNSSNAVVDTYTATASSNAWSVNVTNAQAQALADGSYTVTANVSDQYGNAALQASQAVTVHETFPSIAINPVDGNNIITTAEAAAGVTIGGTESNADGQAVTVDLLNSSSTVVDSYTATAAAGAWSVSVTAAQAQALGDGSYTVTANASDQYGDPASQAAEGVSVIPSVSGNVDEWLLSNGQWAASAGPGSHPSGYSVAGVGDFTGSGTDGILWYDASTGNTDEWEISGGTYAGSVDLGAHPGNFQIAGVGDFTGNGTDDVLWTSSSNGQVQTDIWELSGGQWAASVSPGSHPAGYQVAGVGDFTGNGTDDILWQNPTTGDVDEWQLSNGQWAGSVDIGPHPGSGWQIAGVGDFTGNGISDILWTNSSGGQVQTDIWELGSNGQWVASISPGSHPAGYQVAGIGDFTGNGTSDILWQNSATGDMDEWQIAGGQWNGSVDLGAHPGNTPVSGVGDFTGSGTSDILFHTSSS